MDISSSGVAIHVDLTAGMTMSDVAAAINAKNGAISATTANGQLRLTAKQTGADSAITVSNATGGAAAIGLTSAVVGSDATGRSTATRSRASSNQVTTAISGVTLNLMAATWSGRGLADGQSVAGGQRSITSKLQDFVKAYNDGSRPRPTS